MTSAKPQSMAAQTEAPDDLIAELARLMADEARNDQPETKVEPAPVRIPGASQTDPAPRPEASPRAEAQPGQSAPKPVRIPGGDSDTPVATEPFSFDFGFAPKQAEAGPTSPISADPIERATAEPPEQAPPAQDLAPLDQDSLADLIAAELASDLPAPNAPEPSPSLEAEPDSHAKDEDNFGMPPIFGLGGKPTMAAPAEEETPAPQSPPAVAAPATERVAEAKSEPLDPLDEIERLVGPAVRASSPQSAPASPALRSLATPTIAVPTPAKAERVEPVKPQAPTTAPADQDQGAGLTSVDEAILAAAAATGAHIEWVNAGGAADTPRETEALAEPQRSPRRINRAVAGPLVAVGLLAMAGFGLYWVLGQGGAPSGPAPLVVADTSPTKEIPEAEVTEMPAQSVVFNEISGADTAEGEQLVSRDQADTEAVVAASSTPANAGILADAGSTTVDPNQDGLVNRKVRTVTVRPDGTIVSGDDSLAGSAILPVDRPDVPEVPGADFSTPELVASAQAETATPAAVETPVAETATPAAPAAEPGSDIAVVDATGAAVPGTTARMPMERPADFASIASAAIAAANANPAPVAATPTASAPAAAPQPAATTTAGGSAAAYVQLASQRSEEAARQSAQAIATRYGVLFGGASLEIQRVDLGERGIYYRVLVPAASRDSASNICTNVKAAGGDCLLL